MNARPLLSAMLGAVLLASGSSFAVAEQPASGSVVQVEPAACASGRLLVATRAGIRQFQVEIADTVESRAQGLMYRTEVPAGTGMLFIYDRAAPVSFWMRNTLVSLDLVFIDEVGVIRHVHSQARPLDETPIPGAAIGDPNPDRMMVLEIAGGEAKRLGLAPGQPVAHPRLDAARAAWPCR